MNTPWRRGPPPSRGTSSTSAFYAQKKAERRAKKETIRVRKRFIEAE
jgi:hypothetical protein